MLAVLGALFANGLIAILKLIGAIVTGSSGMMAEALHSVADTTNQVLLIIKLGEVQELTGMAFLNFDWLGFGGGSFCSCSVVSRITVG